MRILIVGAGATGGLFGVKLAQAGADVTFLVRPGRKQQLTDRGLRLLSGPDETVVKPVLLDADEVRESGKPFDLVLLTVKNPALDSALTDLEPAVGPDTLVLPVLNGVRHIDVLRDRFGAQRVVAAAARVVTSLTDDGDIRQLAPTAELQIGALPGADLDLAPVRDALAVEGIQVTVEDDIESALWAKWAFIASVGAVTTLGGGTVGDVAQVPGGTDVSEALLDEIGSVFAAAGHPLPDPFRKSLSAQLSDVASGLTSSMYRDLRADRPTEHESILGDLSGVGAPGWVPPPPRPAARVPRRGGAAS